MNQNYKNVNCCYNCQHVDMDDIDEAFCDKEGILKKLNAMPGDIDKEWEEAYDKWAESHRCDINGICDFFKLNQE